MKDLKMIRKAAAFAALVPLTIFGLAACAPAESDGDRSDERPEPTSAQGQSSEAGQLPFAFPGGQSGSGSQPDPTIPSGPDTDPQPQPDPEPTTGGTGGGTGGTGGGTGGTSSGPDTVTLGDIDLSDTNWSTMCSFDPEYSYIIASDDDIDYSVENPELGPRVTIAIDEGVPSYISIDEGGDDGLSLWWSNDFGEGEATITAENGRFQAEGYGYDLFDYEYNDRIDFVVDLGCDYTF